MINVTREVKAVLNGETGRVLAWHNDKEARAISIAVPGDRAKLTPAQARELGLWLIEAAETITKVDRTPLRNAAVPGAERPASRFGASGVRNW
jgi:hypothetical protein